MKNDDPRCEYGDGCAELGLYPIRVVSKQTGIGIHTLRAWERRYGLPRPSRTAGTHRLYGVDDIALLRRVLNLIHGGAPPSRACALVLAERSGPTPAIAPESDGSWAPTDRLRGGLCAAFVDLDEGLANRILSESFCLLGPELALTEVVLPALADIGTAWEHGRASVAAEHFGSGLIRARLLTAIEAGSRGDDLPIAVLGAGPCDQHEIPAMVLALFLRRRGWRAIFLGASTPCEALAYAIMRKRPQLVCLSCATDETVAQLVDAFLRLRRMAEFGSIVFAYGGPPFRDNPDNRVLLEGTAIYLGDDLQSAADRADALVRRMSKALSSRSL